MCAELANRSPVISNRLTASTAGRDGGHHQNGPQASKNEHGDERCRRSTTMSEITMIQFVRQTTFRCGAVRFMSVGGGGGGGQRKIVLS